MYRLKIRQTLVHSDDVNVNLGGSLTYPTINIPANTPTEIFSYDDEESWDYGNWTIDIQENGRWVEIIIKSIWDNYAGMSSQVCSK